MEEKPKLIKVKNEYRSNFKREVWTFQGTTYSRFVAIDPAHSHGAKYETLLTVDGEPRVADAPEVLCTCGSVLFSLRYGDYEIVARCAHCGAEGVVYDG